MAVLKVVNYGNPILRKICEPVKDFAKLDTIIADMFDSMYEAEGIGLAANQVGLPYRVLVAGHHSQPDEIAVLFLSLIHI